MADQPTQSTASKLIGVVAALAATFVAQKLISTAWKSTTGHKPPKPTDDDDAGIAEVAAAAAITGAVVAVVRAMVTRRASRALRTSAVAADR